MIHLTSEKDPLYALSLMVLQVLVKVTLLTV